MCANMSELRWSWFKVPISSWLQVQQLALHISTMQALTSWIESNAWMMKQTANDVKQRLHSLQTTDRDYTEAMAMLNPIGAEVVLFQ